MTAENGSLYHREQISVPERALHGRRLIFIKGGLGIGGASLSDLAVLDWLADYHGASIDLITGFIDSSLLRVANISPNIRFHHDPSLHRDNGKDFNASRWLSNHSNLLRYADGVIYSQAFAFSEALIGQPLAEYLSRRFPTIIRAHDPINTSIAQIDSLSRGTVFMPTSPIIGDQIRRLSHVHNVIEVPVSINEKLLNSNMSRDEARRMLGLSIDEIVLFQPTHLNAKKRAWKALLLAINIQNHLETPVSLFISSGHNPEHAQERKKLLEMAQAAGFKNLRIGNGLSHQEMSWWYKAADAATFMSAVESWGMPVAETALLGTPCVTSSFRDSVGEVEKALYNDFKIAVDDNNFGIDLGTVQWVERVSLDPSFRQNVIEHNRRCAMRYHPHAVREAALKVVAQAI